ncbi:MAG: type II toxin-antitoxin system HicB family antitoxin [Proteobacteria bacterium]|nr:type II toxin-antitoxin system HicB family antitoxin [Pseudomonadota bacterium]
MGHYIAIIHKDKGSSFGVLFPDVPGCYSAGKSVMEAFTNATEALSMHIEALEAEGMNIPPACSLEKLKLDKKFVEQAKGGTLLYIPLFANVGRKKRVNITVEENFLDAIDIEAAKRGLTRTSFLLQSVKKEILKAG